MKGVIIDFQQTGVNKIDITFCAKKWNHLWTILHHRGNNMYRLIKYLRKDSPITTLKTEISERQAKLLINALSLEG